MRDQFNQVRAAYVLLGLCLASLSACTTTKSAKKIDAPELEPETMLVTYYVKRGKEAEFQQVLAQAWEIFCREQMVLAKPHFVLRDHEDAGTTRFVESFTWVSHYAPDHAPDSVKAIWRLEQSLCEARAGHQGIEGSEVDPIVPKLH